MTDPLDLALAKRLERIRTEADARGYLGGSDWSERDSIALEQVIDHLRGGNGG